MSAGNDLNFVQEALPAFISEAQEQVANVEQLLLQLEDSPDDRELLHALFRCAHTIKGSAGIFGLDRVVAFTHHVENLLDRLREGEVSPSAELSTLLLKCNDQILALVEQARDGKTVDDPEGDAIRDDLVRQLRATGQAPATVQAPPPAASPEATDPVADGAGNARRWHVQARFGTETYRNGMDPMAILNYVRGLGTIAVLTCDLARVPPLDEVDPEACHLSFEFGLDTAATRSDIEGAFSFVRDDCDLHIVEPGATPDDYAAAIDALPDHPRIGDILVNAGAITRVQLDHALRRQSEAAAEGKREQIGQVLQQVAGVSPRVVGAALNKQTRQRDPAPASAAHGGEDQRFIRVQADRLDAVINLLGELVIAGAGASLLARQAGNRTLHDANAHVGQLIEEVRNGTLQLRMVPIGETFARFRRVVRDTAAELGKEVALEIQGGDTELDKSVVERITDPLMHLVRNALDHGLETVEQRREAGKEPQGRLVMAACHESGSILIRITDDGRGIQRQKVLERAWDRGLVERGTVPADADIDKLIFEPGFSTADQVTNLSGRGVGMDVVRRNIEALRGTVTMLSEPGKGSCIEIRLPLTLAIIDGFLVGVGPSKFIFPLDAVVEVIEDRPASGSCDRFGRGLVELRDQPLPVVGIRRLYGLDSEEPERSSIVVLSGGGRRFGVRVDSLLGQHQTVIKPLGSMFKTLPGMSGSAILGNGEVALIFDVAALSQTAAGPPGGPPGTDLAAIDAGRPELALNP